MSNILSIDVEEYFHANNLQKVAPVSSWDTLPSRVVDSTNKLLKLLSRKSVKATFFVLGYVAKKHPSLVKEIAQHGHEISSHGFMHQLVYDQSPEQFYNDINDAKKLLEDLSGKEVLGYRAPSFSITEKSPWAYSQLCRAGYRYDSSRYPIWHPRYNNLGKSCDPEIITTEFGKITVYPLATASIKLSNKEIRLPIAGGAYWRHLPLSYIKWGMSQNLKKEINVYYLHPWEIDSAQPRFKELGKVTQLRHYGGSKNFLRKIEILIDKFTFTSFREVIS